MRARPTALVVMPDKRHGALLAYLQTLDIPFQAVESCQQARNLLRQAGGTKVVITDVTLPDGNWCDIFRYLVNQNIPASVIVASRLADERLWSEVLWRGAYDLLVEPYDSGEVRRIVEGALRSAESKASQDRAYGAGTSEVKAGSQLLD